MPIKSLFIICCLFIALFASTTVAQKNEVDIPALLREAKEKSDENWRKMISVYANYGFKRRKIMRETKRNGEIKEESELYEVFFPSKCKVKKCSSAAILLEENGKPVAPEKIEKERIKAAERLEKVESHPEAIALPLKRDYPLHWLRFTYWSRSPFEIKTLAKIDGQEILEKCDFFAPQKEIVNGREMIALSFRPRADATFSEETSYMPNMTGKIWIDAADKVFVRLAIWEKSAKFNEMTSDFLLNNAPLVYDMTRTKEGIWFIHLGRINGLKNPTLFARMKEDFSLENYDFRYFKTEIEKGEVIESIKPN